MCRRQAGPAALLVGDQAVVDHRHRPQRLVRRFRRQVAGGGRGDRRRVQPAAHEDGHARHAQAVGDGAIEVEEQLVDPVVRPPPLDRRLLRDLPVAPDRHPPGFPLKDVGGGQAPDLGEGGALDVQVVLEKHQVGDRQLVQRGRDGGMLPHGVQGVAEDELPLRAGVEERLDPELVPRRQQAPRPAVPQHEGEVADQVPHAVHPPGRVGMQDQRRVGSLRRHRLAAAGELGAQLGLTVDPRVGGDPDLAIKGQRLRARPNHPTHHRAMQAVHAP